MDDIVTLSLEDFREMTRKGPTKHRKSYYGLIEEYTLDGFFIRKWESAAEAAEYYNISTSSIFNCIKEATLLVRQIGRVFIKEGSNIEERLDKIENEELNPKRKAAKVAVDEYDINGKYIKTYQSLTEINATPSSIKRCCKGETLYTKYNKIFLFSGSSIKTRLLLIEQKRYEEALDKSVNEYSKEGKIIYHWRSTADIVEKYNISATKIIDCCLGKSNSVRGKIFLFSGDSIRERMKRIKSKKKIKSC